MKHARKMMTVAVSIGAGALLGAPVVWGDPVAPSAGQDSVAPDPSSENVSAAAVSNDSPTADNPVSAACRQFGAALAVAAANYEDFAYATAGSGNYVDYRDPAVGRSNVVGRTALREAAAAALSAAGTPGLPSEVSSPMRSWSLHATKLLLVMGLHGGGDTLNSAANQVNSDADTAQTACAVAMQAG